MASEDLILRIAGPIVTLLSLGWMVFWAIGKIRGQVESLSITIQVQSAQLSESINGLKEGVGELRTDVREFGVQVADLNRRVARLEGQGEIRFQQEKKT